MSVGGLSRELDVLDLLPSFPSQEAIAQEAAGAVPFGASQYGDFWVLMSIPIFSSRLALLLVPGAQVTAGLIIFFTSPSSFFFFFFIPSWERIMEATSCVSCGMHSHPCMVKISLALQIKS